MKKHSKFLVLLLSVMMVFTLIPTAAFAEGDGSAVTPELVSETLWAGTEAWSSPHFSNIDANDIDVISVSSSDTGILNVECYGDSTNILSYILFPGDPGTAVITVNFMLGEEEYTVSGEYTVKAFPVFLSSLYIDGEAISAEDYNYHNFYDIEDYEGTSPNVQFTVAEGWNFDNAYYNRSLNNGNFEEIFLGENLPEEGWTFDFSDDYNKLNTFYVFRSDEGEKIQFGIRFTKSEGGVDPGDEKVLDIIEITNINTEIIPGEKVEFTAELLSANMTIENERWFKTDQMKILTGGSDDLPEVGEEYKYFITIKVDEGYSFADDPTVKYNGEVVDADIHVDSETNLSITGIIPDVTVTEQEVEEPEEMAVDFYDTTGNLTWYWVPEYGPATYELRITNAGSALPETPCATKYIESGSGPFYFMIYQEINNLLNNGTLTKSEAYRVSLSAVNQQGKVFQKWEKNNLIIPKKEFTDDTVSLDKTVYPYTGSNVKISVYYRTTLLGASDYSLSYSSRPNEIGDYTVTITAYEGSEYTGSVIKSFKIKGDLAGKSIVPTVTLDPADGYVYTGNYIQPTVASVTFAGKTLAKDVDYSVSYRNNKKAGTGYVIISAKDDSYYMGEKEIPFRISPLEVSVPKAKTGLTYTGKAQVGVPTGTYYTITNNSETNAGSYTATATLKDTANYVWKDNGSIEPKTISWKIAPKKITPTVTLSATSYTYDGKVKKPTLTVKNGSTKLTTASYTVTYASGRKNVGSYTVTVKPATNGNYTWTAKKVTFKINPKGTTLKTMTATSKGFKATWTKQATKMSTSYITGYQIQYSTSSKFTTSTTKTVTVTKYSTVSKTVSKLTAKKKYYVRIRTYKTVSGTKYYSPWSASKYVTTKA